MDSPILLSDFSDDFAKEFLADARLSSRARRIGMSYLVESYIHGVTIALEENDSKQLVNVSGKCYRSQRKSDKPHTVTLHLSKPDYAVVESLCSCTAG